MKTHLKLFLFLLAMTAGSHVNAKTFNANNFDSYLAAIDSVRVGNGKHHKYKPDFYLIEKQNNLSNCIKPDFYLIEKQNNLSNCIKPDFYLIEKQNNLSNCIKPDFYLIEKQNNLSNSEIPLHLT